VSYRRRHREDATPRIVSLLPSTTEIACALGFRDQLVGRSHECDFPPGVDALPALTEAKLDASAASRAIDDRVKQLVGEGLSVYRVDAERLRALAPDVILTQTHCEVCAASPADLDDALRAWTGARPTVVSLEGATLGDVWDDFGRVAAALGACDRGRELTTELSGRVADLGERAGRATERPRVACLEWIDPLMAAGHWIPELVAIANALPVFGRPGARSPWISFDDLARADADAIVVVPCGFGLSRTRAELAPLREHPGFSGLRAVRGGRIFLADGNAYFNRPGPRLVESLEILCEILHPALFAPRRRGAGWEALAPG
jgi:iron complex transport system substrate-binding protein